MAMFSSPTRLALAVSVIGSALAAIPAGTGLRAIDAVGALRAGRRAQRPRPAWVAEAGASDGVAVTLLAVARLLAAFAVGVCGTRVPTSQTPLSGLADQGACLRVAAHAQPRALFAAAGAKPAGSARDLTVDALVAARTHARAIQLKQIVFMSNNKRN